jgi:hypothetical protein
MFHPRFGETNIRHRQTERPHLLARSQRKFRLPTGREKNVIVIFVRVAICPTHFVHHYLWYLLFLLSREPHKEN